MYIDTKILEKYVNDGWLIKQKHPTLPLEIYNYSANTQYEKHWDEITLLCRGLIVEIGTGKVIAKPFSKFFNIEEKLHTPTNNFIITEKLDGSLIILFYYRDSWRIASRGSFTSDQAILARKLLKKFNTNALSKKATYLFELIGESNRIVVKYSEDKLVLIGGFREMQGVFAEESRPILKFKSNLCNCDIVKVYDFKDYKTIKDLNWDNHEGFVVRFDNGDRCKIKFEDYLVLHAIITKMSSYSIWEFLLKYGDVPAEIVSDVPDEFYNWVQNMIKKIKSDYNKIKKDAVNRFNSLSELYYDRPKFAEEAKKYKYKFLLFLLLDIKLISEKKEKELDDYIRINKKNKTFKGLIYKNIKPKYERPFDIKIDDENK